MKTFAAAIALFLSLITASANNEATAVTINPGPYILHMVGTATGDVSPPPSDIFGGGMWFRANPAGDVHYSSYLGVTLFYSNSVRANFDDGGLTAVANGDPAVGPIQLTGTVNRIDFGGSYPNLFPNNFLTFFTDGTWTCSVDCQFQDHSQPVNVFFSNGGTYTIVLTPIPTALPLLMSGIGLIGFLAWRRKRRLFY